MIESCDHFHALQLMNLLEPILHNGRACRSRAMNKSENMSTKEPRYSADNCKLSYQLNLTLTNISISSEPFCK